MVRKSIVAPTDETGQHGEDSQGVHDVSDRGGVREFNPFESAGGEDCGLVLAANLDAHALDRALREKIFEIAGWCVAALLDAGYLGGEEGQDILSSYRLYLEDLEDGEGILDILAFLVTIRLGSDDEKQVAEMRKLSQIETLAFGKKVTHCPFIQLTELPTSLYEGFPSIREVCRLLMCPVVQVQDTDFVTLASVNPYTAALAGRIVTGVIERETGRKPFVFLLTTDASAWNWLLEKHF